MTETVATHYGGGGDLATKIAAGLRQAGKELSALTTADLAAVDEFHFRGREATLELAAQMGLNVDARVVDIGSGLGGPARTLAETYGCHVTGIDLTEAFCTAAAVLSSWVALDELTAFQQGDATAMPFADAAFDAAMSLHVGMNIPAKDELYREAHRVLKPGGVFAVYDILQGEGGAVPFPVPWAREASISHLASPDEMAALLTAAGFKILARADSSEESRKWLEARGRQKAAADAPQQVTTQVLFGDDFALMVRNQLQALAEKRMRTVSLICVA